MRFAFALALHLKAAHQVPLPAAAFCCKGLPAAHLPKQQPPVAASLPTHCTVNKHCELYVDMGQSQLEPYEIRIHVLAFYLCAYLSSNAAKQPATAAAAEECATRTSRS